MKRTNLLALAFFAALLIAFAGFTGAQEESGSLEPQPSDTATTTSVSGTLVSRNGDSFVVEKDTGARLTFTLDESLVIPSEVEPGDRVTVAFESLDGSEYHAVAVAVAEEPMPAGSQESAAPVPDETGTMPDESMPKTASPLPLFVLIGAITTGAAVGLRAFRRRVV